MLRPSPWRRSLVKRTAGAATSVAAPDLLWPLALVRRSMFAATGHTAVDALIILLPEGRPAGGGWVCAVMRRGECTTVAAIRFPAPIGAANRAASSKQARFLRHWRRFACFPPLSSKEIALHSPRPVGQGSHRSVSFSSPHRTRSAGLRRGPRWSCQRKRAVHGPKEKHSLSKLDP